MKLEAVLPKGRLGFTENWTHRSQFPKHNLWSGTYTYTIALKRRGKRGLFS